MALRAYCKCFSSAFPHNLNPFSVALQIFEFLNLMNLQLLAASAAYFTDPMLHSLF